ncbi:MAG: hypothetical protein ABIU86_01100, partial [Gemmatimonadaceae bacterium]
PRTESWGNYVPTILPQRYDAFLFVDDSRAVDPLHMPAKIDGEIPETFQPVSDRLITDPEPTAIDDRRPSPD